MSYRRFTPGADFFIFFFFFFFFLLLRQRLLFHFMDEDAAVGSGVFLMLPASEIWVASHTERLLSFPPHSDGNIDTKRLSFLLLQNEFEPSARNGLKISRAISKVKGALLANISGVGPWFLHSFCGCSVLNHAKKKITWLLDVLRGDVTSG